MKISELVLGGTYNSWTVLKLGIKKPGDKYKQWCLVRCKCGKEFERVSISIAKGTSRSCISCGLHRHGSVDRPEYYVWALMVQRCNNARCKAYKNYGGRGISVYPEWVGRGGFAKFIDYIGYRPSDNHSIERINNDGNYEPGNVKWATKIEQCNNMRKSRLVTVDGVTHTVSEWARIRNTRHSQIKWRLDNGWSDYDAVMMPSYQQGNQYASQARKAGW